MEHFFFWAFFTHLMRTKKILKAFFPRTALLHNQQFAQGLKKLWKKSSSILIRVFSHQKIRVLCQIFSDFNEVFWSE